MQLTYNCSSAFSYGRDVSHVHAVATPLLLATAAPLLYDKLRNVHNFPKLILAISIKFTP